MDAALVGEGDCTLGLLFGIGFLLQSIGLTMTSASTSAFITGTMVIFVPFVFRVVEGTSVRPLHLVSVAVVAVGLWLFTEPEVKGLNEGDLLTLIAALFWAGYVVYIDLWTKDLNEEPDKDQCACRPPVCLNHPDRRWRRSRSSMNQMLATNWSWPLMAGILYCAVLASVFTTWAQTRFQQFTHPVRAGIIFSMEPIFASLDRLGRALRRMEPATGSRGTCSFWERSSFQTC